VFIHHIGLNIGLITFEIKLIELRTFNMKLLYYT